MNKIYFTAMLLFTSIVNSQITLVKDINNGPKNSLPANLTVFDGKIYFTADDSSGVNTGGVDYGKELWVSDGTTDGTYLLKNINSYKSNGEDLDESQSSSIQYFFELNNKLYFKGKDNQTEEDDIFVTDGTKDGTFSLNNQLDNGQPIIVNGKAYMRADLPEDGNNQDFFYEFDGANFAKVADSGSGTAEPSNNMYIELNSNSILLYMEYTIENSDDDFGLELYLYDITNQTYTLVKNIGEDDDDAGISYATKVGDSVYFEALNELWVTDGTTEGTVKVAIVENNSITGVKTFYNWKDKLFFEGDNGTDGDQLYVYDPTLDTVTNISNLADGANHDPNDYTPIDDYLYYSAKGTDDSGIYLFRTNGKTIEQLDTEIKSVDEIVALNGNLYFEGENDANGKELFKYTPSNPLSNTSFELENSISISPNPSNNYLNVQSTLVGQLNYAFYNILGKKVLNGSIENNVINHNLSSGLYLLKLDNGTNSISKKIIVKN